MNGKGTDTFKTAIQNYLEYRAATDELFAPLFANPNKSIMNVANTSFVKCIKAE